MSFCTASAPEPLLIYRVDESRHVQDIGACRRVSIFRPRVVRDQDGGRVDASRIILSKTRPRKQTLVIIYLRNTDYLVDAEHRYHILGFPPATDEYNYGHQSHKSATTINDHSLAFATI